MGRKKLTTGMISTLKNVASLKDAIPPRRASLLSFLLYNAWIRIQSFQPITDRKEEEMVR